ncbi:OadG family protein [Pyrococcus yayanosii]|uniref:Methylmalonyl-CoA decarboxylase, delta subunit n=1 Tax=Pyrococcus yayanosii (strain CH1 / JCM 16557) TaxID=529709 RepID=F8AI46_PYRYC|nr:OadG family protein [Pyrococcus yayanosii]AEH24273.1 Methylmalonyl-CoA decarboxylase, delta subunit [Pyrococcus yayanosii CH1]
MVIGGLMEGLSITVLGVTVVFGVLGILAVTMYAIGWLERRLVEKEDGGEEPVQESPPKKGLDEKKIAVITAAIMAYLDQKRPKELPIKRKPSEAWWLSGVTSHVGEVENFNYKLGKW